MPQPTLIRNNQAFAQISVPFNALATSNKVYAAAGPFEPFVHRLSFPPGPGPAAPEVSWNHAEFGFSDHGARYFVKVTEVVAGVESHLFTERPLVIGFTQPDDPIPLVLARVAGSIPTTYAGTPGGDLGDFVVSVRDYEAFRVVLDVTVPTGALEFRVMTSRTRTGTFRPHQVAQPSGVGGIVVLDAGLFRVTASGVASVDLDVRESRFVRVDIREFGGVAGDRSVTEIAIERVGRMAPTIRTF